MKQLLLIIPLLFSGCASADISLNREEVKSVKTVLIVPFTSGMNLKKEIYNESEDTFRRALVKLNYKVIDRDKLDSMLKDKEYITTGLTPENIKKIAKRLGADSVLTGEIAEHREYVEVKRYHNSLIIGKYFLNSNHRDDDTKDITHFKFRIIVKLANAEDGSEIFTIKNRYDDYDAETFDDTPLYISFDTYRKGVLDKLAEELVKAVNKKN